MRLITLASLVAGVSSLRSPRALKLTGGSTKLSDIARVVGAGNTLVDSTFTYTYARKFVKKGSDAPAVVSVRGMGHWNGGLAALLFADASDVRALVAFSHYVVVLNLLADVPANDALDAPQAPIVALMAIFGALGYGTSRGVVPLWIAAASAIVNGLQFFLTPKAAWKAYGADGKGVSEEAVVWTRLIGWSIEPC